ncbi:MAG: PilT/PilU family type 4a pilus ATPase [Acidobacteria bacterium]|nr:PilT/PilU family type 4a pilus ATPase [Acidobacteriota bacterium]MBV9070634.1 PilT/PilU family type 4a pilus ATPase [Acidobacteriota bacterium]MBV9478179.1 PilT/PilU family type 4a pilus ATPase [Acidobacteriota bacterium]
MAKLIRDPQLEQLVRELNDVEPAPDEARAATPAAAWPSATVAEGNPLEKLLIDMAQRGASDLLIVAGVPPVLRVGGRLARTADAPLTSDDIHNLLGSLLTLRLREKIDAEGAADFSLRLAGPASEDDRRAGRFRVNVHRQRGTWAASVRALPTEVPTLTQLRLPPALGELVKPTRGLVLVCGPTGSGKSTTLAALVGEVNRNDARHVITIEDPIEYEHRNAKSIIEQVEVGRDAPSFAAALRASLRQDPDVILVGEMRDLETVATALTAAETGHLILSTLHTSDAAQAIHRIVDVFPPAQQTQIKQQLALSLNAIVVQQLIPRADNQGRAVAVEVLLANQAVRNHIRNERLQNLATEITLGKRQGMISLEDSLAKLVADGLITIDDARVRSSRPDELESVLRTSR